MTRIGPVLGGAAVALVAAGLWYVVASPARPAAPAAPNVSTTTAAVTVGDVTQRVSVAGTLGYAGRYSVVSQLPAGVLTAAVAPGTVVNRGERLFAVSGTGAVLLFGTTPAYRDFRPGMSDGSDVRALEDNLVALGLDPNRAIRVDGHLNAATTAAIRRWQADSGLPLAQRTGMLPLGQVVFLPGPIRVTEVAAIPGATVPPGTEVLAGSSTTRVVSVQLPTAQQHLVHLGDEVQVTLPVVSVVPGTVTQIGRVAARDANGTGGPPTIPITIGLTLPAGTGDLDEAPVQIAITTARRQGVLMVPVTALLAKDGGGYQVRVVDSGGARLLDVEPGLFDDAAGTVEVAGAGLTAGITVEVPVT